MRSLAGLLDACLCDVIVSDIGMPGIGGESNAISSWPVLRHAPHLPVVALTMISQARTLMGLLHMGVTAIVDKRDAATSLIEAIDAAFAGRRICPITCAVRLARLRATSGSRRVERARVGGVQALCVRPDHRPDRRETWAQQQDDQHAEVQCHAQARARYRRRSD